MVVELSWFQVEDVENPHSGPTTASTTNSTFNYARDIVRPPLRFGRRHAMTITCIPGITIACDGKRIINKEYRGVRVFRRLGYVSQDDAEQRLHVEIEQIEAELERKAHARPKGQINE
jgi:hypothetical protein